MPALSFFADTDDVNLFVEHLNEDPEIAFLVPVPPIGPLPEPAFRFGNSVIAGQHWQAVRAVESLGDGQYSLWHVPAGDLCERAPSPTLVPPPGTRIADPWTGWTGRSIVVNADKMIPNVQSGPGDSGIVRLDLTTRYRRYSAEELATLAIRNAYWTGPDDMLVCSTFQWIGSRYQRASKETARWWIGLRRWFGRATVKLSDSTGRQSFYAFPSALRLLKSGIKYTAYNWNLHASIQVAP